MCVCDFSVAGDFSTTLEMTAWARGLRADEERPYHALSKVSTGVANLPAGAPCRRTPTLCGEFEQGDGGDGKDDGDYTFRGRFFLEKERADEEHAYQIDNGHEREKHRALRGRGE